MYLLKIHSFPRAWGHFWMLPEEFSLAEVSGVYRAGIHERLGAVGQWLGHLSRLDACHSPAWRLSSAASLSG